jgi:alkanesulfonate monooxygenase SsuD/methylene tetrahydromethanopterin reductase-like flavin-dependent oxidoreductase (luciferase family)
VPILVGGQGEQRTLRLVARHADACNLFGDPDTVRRKLAVLREHCVAEGRDPSSIEVTHLATAAADATVEEHVGRYRELAEAGVQTAIVGLTDVASVRQFAEVIAAFGSPPSTAPCT